MVFSYFRMFKLAENGQRFELSLKLSCNIFSDQLNTSFKISLKLILIYTLDYTQIHTRTRKVRF